MPDVLHGRWRRCESGCARCFKLKLARVPMMKTAAWSASNLHHVRAGQSEFNPGRRGPLGVGVVVREKRVAAVQVKVRRLLQQFA